MQAARDINYNIMLQADIEDIQSACQVNSEMYNICQDVHFWHSKLKRSHLPLPPVEFISATQWIDYYIFASRIMDYVEKVLDVINQSKNVAIRDINDLSFFHPILDKITLGKWYNVWYKASGDYFRDIYNKYDENVPHGILVVNFKDGVYRFVLQVGKYDIATNAISYQHVVAVLYHFISCYQYPHDIDSGEVYDII